MVLSNNENAVERRCELRTPSLILMMGVAGTGKSTLSKMVLQQIWAAYLSNDFIADAFFAETREAPEYLKLRDGIYKALYRITEENLKVGNSTLLDVPHVTHMKNPEWQSYIQSLADQNHARLCVVRCFCSEATLRSRLEERGEERDRPKLSNLAKFLEEQPMRVPIQFPHLDVNTDEDWSLNSKRVVEYIVASNPAVARRLVAEQNSAEQSVSGGSRCSTHPTVPSVPGATATR